MYKAILIFKHTWYSYDGESSRNDTVVLSANTLDELNLTINKKCNELVSSQYGDFGLMTHKCILLSTDIFETK